MWINAAMLAALVVAALPVIVHLVMRGRPRQMDFPALRFVRQSHLASAGRTRLKRWLLLALRAAALALFVLVLARPIDSSGVVASYQDAPAAAVLCFDTSRACSTGTWANRASRLPSNWPPGSWPACRPGAARPCCTWRPIRPPSP